MRKNNLFLFQFQFEKKKTTPHYTEWFSDLKKNAFMRNTFLFF